MRLQSRAEAQLRTRRGGAGGPVGRGESSRGGRGGRSRGAGQAQLWAAR